ncbi:uncharacterized protein LOC132295868 [Cornus florida]|uniref:uncharacterized protein LOC132295868 n=1 Tax=Cornus florida TaxID=4283 RepID=UPI0028A015F4|nr:uncharacterized protein LOC132295868 [Cornus florida]
MAKEKNVELSQRQMKNQWDYMKKKYLTWKTLMKNIRNGNDPDTKNWGAEKWNDYIKENPDAKQFRYVGLQYIDELKSLFDGITMIGQAAQSPSRTCLFSDGVKNSASSQPEVGSSQIGIDLESSSSIMPSNQSKDMLLNGKRRNSNKYGDLDDHLSAILKTLEKSDGPSIEECHHYLDGMHTLQVEIIYCCLYYLL